jgi:hypothetical protein
MHPGEIGRFVDPLIRRRRRQKMTLGHEQTRNGTRDSFPFLLRAAGFLHLSLRITKWPNLIVLPFYIQKGLITRFNTKLLKDLRIHMLLCTLSKRLYGNPVGPRESVNMRLWLRRTGGPKIK